MKGRPARASSRPSPQDFASALVAVCAGLCSLLLAGITTLVGITLGRMELEGSLVRLTPVSWLDMSLALGWALGVPLLVAYWKHHRDGSAIWSAMCWLPIVTNGVGLLVAVLCAPSLMSQALHRSDTLVAKVTGEQSSLTQAASAVAEESAHLIAPLPQTPPQPLTHEIGQDTQRTQNIALDMDGNGVFVDLTLEGPKGSLKATYLFDTGASYTTITRKQANQLGIAVPHDAPSLEFNTAAGLRKSPMVYLPKLSLGEVSVEGLLVSVCDSCATSRYPGLLGINVMREFHVALDYQSRRMRLTPRTYDGPPNRAYDIEPTLSMKIVGRPEVWMKNIRWTASVTNRGTHELKDVMLKVRFGDDIEIFSKAIPRLRPKETRRTSIRGRLGRALPKAAEFTLSLASARW